MDGRYLGLIELVAVVVIFAAWFIRDRRGLRRDIAARKARERAARQAGPPADMGEGHAGRDFSR